MSGYERNTSGLKKHARRKQKETLKKVDDSIQRLIKEKKKINFNSVSIESGVSKTYLYTRSNLRERIEQLRQEQQALAPKGRVKRQMTDAGKDVLIAAKNKRIKELSEENKRLKAELERLRGRLYESVG